MTSVFERLCIGARQNRTRAGNDLAITYSNAELIEVPIPEATLAFVEYRQRHLAIRL
jgi:hypothetical protein